MQVASEVFQLLALFTNNTKTLSPSHLNISIHILHTVLYTFPMAVTRRNKVKIKSFSRFRSLPQFS